MTDHPRITVLPGDGIGPEVTEAAVEVLSAVGTFDFDERPIGACAVSETGAPLPEATLNSCLEADATLLGAVGTGVPPADPHAPRPEQAVLELRTSLSLYANLRPVRTFPALHSTSPLRPERIEGTDLTVVRELTGGLYFGQRERTSQQAFDTCVYTRQEIERISRVAFELASGKGSRARVTSVDKANVLDTSRLWREVVQDIADREYPEVELEHLLVDTAAMRLVTDPRQFDIVLTENMFGDILSDETAVIAGSLGSLPSASLPAPPNPLVGVRGGLFEPVHGSAPDISGTGSASPIGSILSAALMLRHGLGLSTVANVVEIAVRDVLDKGFRTPDLGGTTTTKEFTRALLSEL
ncbi:3-isopropylmalate dehydrogenase [Actinopolyspora lacussalsi subsp. righensis]|uniref:3-isopropylmalate dehydrogenase n=1 Tax=Actinopolyspora righensis TaxID=995060 RepID=A0A1I7CFV7_9ACTN|nr:3-isopropylmalate dehydrogenase [Actinopolyspora righensis]SFT98299.1 3-isopropylmalate dehydrogenase [Actinopolyspora righensis]